MAPVAEPSGATGDHGTGLPKERDTDERKAKEETDETPELAPSEGDAASDTPSPAEEAPSDSQSGKKRDSSDSGSSGSGSSGSGNSGPGNRSDAQQLDDSGSQSPKSGKNHE